MRDEDRLRAAVRRRQIGERIQMRGDVRSRIDHRAAASRAGDDKGVGAWPGHQRGIGSQDAQNATRQRHRRAILLWLYVHSTLTPRPASG
jgi:hypothetical protein